MMSDPSPLLGPQLDWFIQLYSPFPRTGITWEWCCLLLRLLGLLAHCWSYDISLDGLLPQAFWKEWFHRRTRGWGTWYLQGLHWSLVQGGMQCSWENTCPCQVDGVDGGSDQQKSGQVGHAINNIDGECSCCASSHRCSCIWARGGRENSTCQQCCSWRSLCPSEFSD